MSYKAIDTVTLNIYKILSHNSHLFKSLSSRWDKHLQLLKNLNVCKALGTTGTAVRCRWWKTLVSIRCIAVLAGNRAECLHLGEPGTNVAHLGLRGSEKPLTFAGVRLFMLEMSLNLNLGFS